MTDNKNNGRFRGRGIRESAGFTEKRFGDLASGEIFSMTPDGRRMQYSGDVTGSYSGASPTRMEYFMGGYRDETGGFWKKADLLDAVVCSWGMPEGYVPPADDELHDRELLDDACSTTYRDTIIDCANRCRKRENRERILSLLDDPDVVLEESAAAAGTRPSRGRSASPASSRRGAISESAGGEPVMTREDIGPMARKIRDDAWINAMYDHFMDVRDEKNDDTLEMAQLAARQVSRTTGLPEKFIRVIFGYALFVVDIDVSFTHDGAEVPAYLHVTRETATGKWNAQVFRRGH